jgi:hypothetical protein
LDLSSATLAHEFWLAKSRFESDVLLSSLYTPRAISLHGSTCTRPLKLNGLKVDGQLRLREVEGVGVELAGAQIKGQLDMDKSKFTGVTKTLLDGSSVTVGLYMTSLTVGGNLRLREAEGAGLDLRSAHIGGGLLMSRASLTGNITMDGMRVDGGLFMDRITVNPAISIPMRSMKIGASLVLSGATLPSLNLTGTQVSGDFRLGAKAPPTRWQEKAKLVLRHMNVGTLQDLRAAWPDELELDGFTSALLGGVVIDPADDMLARDVPWFTAWLAKQKNYSLPPYEQLTSILERTGHQEKAREIRFESRERERSNTTGSYWLWLTGLKWAIGYGYRYRYALWWTVFWVAIGMGVLLISWMFKPSPSPRWPSDGRRGGYHVLDSLFFSFDLLLPIISLDIRHESEIVNDEKSYHPLAVYYFYIHQAVGYLLAFFLVAGLAGLTK